MIRLARRQEFSSIEAWRKLHFASLKSPRPVIGQKGFDDAVWLVADRDGTAVAAISYTLDIPSAMLFVHDLYAAPGHPFAAVGLAAYLEQFCDYHRYELRGATDPENLAFLRYIWRRGYEPTAVHYRRVPRVAIEQAVGGGTTAPADEAEGAVFISGRAYAV